MKSESQSAKRVKVIKLVYGIPHYRVPIFRRLSENPDMDFIVCAGQDTSKPGGSNVVSAAELGITKGVNWRRVDSRLLKLPLLKDFEWQPEVVKIAWKEDFDVLLVIGQMSVSNCLARLICRLRGIPVVEWTIGARGPRRGLKWMFLRAHGWIAGAHLLYGAFARDFFVQHGFSEEEVFVVRNSLDYDEQVRVREKLTAEDLRRSREEFGAADPNDRLVFFSGRFEARKNLDLLIKAIGMLKSADRRIVLVLIGDGREEESLRNLAREEGLQDQVIFYGCCYDEPRLGRIISACDLCVSPGATGLTVVHSLVYGTPLLTCDNGNWIHGPEVEAVIEGKTGGFFREGDIGDLVQKLESMLYPVSCRNKMTRACMDAIAESFTPAYQERVVIQALNHVLPVDKQIPLPDQA